MIRYFLALLFAFVSTSAFAQMTCGTKSTNVDSTFRQCVSSSYAPSTGQMTAGPTDTDDPLSYLQWGLTQLFEGEAYDDLLGDAPRDVVVAVIGEWPGHGNHPDLTNVYLSGGLNFVERDGSGNPTAMPASPPGGYDNNVATGSNMHDQCAAGVIAAQFDNEIGGRGVFHRARIRPYRADIFTLAEAIDKAVEDGAEVIHIPGIAGDQEYLYYAAPNFWPSSSSIYQPIRPMFQYPATQASFGEAMIDVRDAVNRAAWNNVLISTVVGNWAGKITVMMLPSFGNTISTMASNIRGEVSPDNSTFHGTDVLAPGGDRRAKTATVSTPASVIKSSPQADEDDIFCPIGPDKYSYGTLGSFAGPHTAGLLAIIKSYRPDANIHEARCLLEKSKQPLGMTNLHLVGTVNGLASVPRLIAAMENDECLLPGSGG